MARPELDQFYFDVFVTASEGGIGYWATGDTYHIWLNPEEPDILKLKEDVLGFYFDIREDDAGDGEPGEWVRLDRKLIAKGVRTAIKLTPSAEFRRILMSALRDPEDADIDAADADVIVQYALFGEVRYG